MRIRDSVTVIDRVGLRLGTRLGSDVELVTG